MPEGRPADYPHIVKPGLLTPTPQRQAAFVGATLGIGIAGRLPPGIQARLLNYGVKTYAAAVAMGDSYPAFGPEQKFAVRYGGTGEVTTMGQAIPFTQMYGPAAKYTPWPDIGFGLTAVPNTSSRWVYEMNKSRPGEHTSRSGTPETGKSIPGASAQKGRSGPSSKKPGRRIPLADRRGPATSRERRPRTVRYRKGGCPPGYRYDRRRKMCVLTS